MSVGPTRGPFQRPSADRDLAELFQRVEDLERVAPPIVEHGSQYLSGNGVSIASGAEDYLTFDNDAGPDALVDPTGIWLSNPRFLEQGTYAVSVVVQGSNLNTDASFSMFLNMSAISGSYLVDTTVNASPSNDDPRGALTLIGRVGPDAAPTSLGVITVLVGNKDSVPRFFGLASAWIQRIE